MINHQQPIHGEVPLPHHPLIPSNVPDKEEAAPVPAPRVYLPAKQSWQYKILRCAMQDGALPATAQLDELGAAGWELTAALPVDNMVHFYFKRAQ